MLLILSELSIQVGLNSYSNWWTIPIQQCCGATNTAESRYPDTWVRYAER